MSPGWDDNFVQQILGNTSSIKRERRRDGPQEMKFHIVCMGQII